MPSAIISNIISHNGASSTDHPGATQYTHIMTAIIAAATPKSTIAEGIDDSGNTNRGKKTFEINCELPIRQLLVFVSVLANRFHPKSPANENSKYGTPS